MKKGEKKKQQRALNKRSQEKTARRQERAAGPQTALRHIRRARECPLEGCWTSRDWKEAGLAVVVVARRQPDGNLVFGNYLVDYYCLGLKSTFCNAEIPTGEFYREYLPQFLHHDAPLEIPPGLAHELIYGSIDYAARFGFRPHRDFKLSKDILDPPDRYPPTGEVEFGFNGKPLFVAGPHDNVDAIMRQLTRTAGEGNFDYVVEAMDEKDEPLDLDDR